jgi:hypothetical protein
MTFRKDTYVMRTEIFLFLCDVLTKIKKIRMKRLSQLEYLEKETVQGAYLCVYVRNIYISIF